MIFLAAISVISPHFILIGCWRQKFTLLWFYAAAGFITEMLTFIVTEKQLIGNAFLLVEFILVSLYYKKQVFKNITLFAIITTSVSLYFILSTLTKPFDYLNLEDASVFCLVYIIYGLMLFYKFLKKVPPENFQHQLSILGINIAIFVYASGALMLFLFSSLQLIQDKEDFYFLWGTLFPCLNIFRYSLIAIALYQKPKYIAE
ncbi:hypothetical protein BH11BAC7_BH11BAC7_04530 [soil metagenome]